MTIEQFIDTRDDITFNIQYAYGEYICYIKYIDTTVIFKNKQEVSILSNRNCNREIAIKKFIEDISESHFEIRHYYDQTKSRSEMVNVPKLEV